MISGDENSGYSYKIAYAATGIAPSGGVNQKLVAIGSQAIKATGRQANTLLRKFAEKAGLEVRGGGSHLKVVNPSTGNTVTTISHSPHSQHTIKSIVDKIMKEAGQ